MGVNVLPMGVDSQSAGEGLREILARAARVEDVPAGAEPVEQCTGGAVQLAGDGRQRGGGAGWGGTAAAAVDIRRLCTAQGLLGASPATV